MSGDRQPVAYVESPLDRIVNVNFGGLAVEFGDGAESLQRRPPAEPRTTSRLRQFNRAVVRKS
jgi:hypothetical protein